MTNKIIQALEWRYATKLFDSTKKISNEHLQVLVESVRLSPTSYGLQAFKLIQVISKEIRKKLEEAAYGQQAVSSAAEFFVLAAQTSIQEGEIDKHMSQLALSKGVSKEEMSGYGQFIKSSVQGMSSDKFLSWNQKQCYIALGMLLESSALLEIDALPMEGFSVEKFDDILGLKEMNLTASVCCALGYRSTDDENQHFNKVRKSNANFVITI